MGAHLDDTLFLGAHIEDANFSEAILKSSNFTRAFVRNCNFTDADLTGSNWRKVKIVETCIWKNVKADKPENFTPDLWKEIQRQNAK